MKNKRTKEELETAVRNNLSIAGVCRELGIRPVGGNYKTLNTEIKKYNINIDHFTGQGWNVGMRYKPFSKIQKIEEILIVNSNYANTNSLKKRLIKEGFFSYKCSNCNLTEWLNKPISLELDHINGINTDNKIENLRILCPNCHSQTPTFRGKQKLSALSEKKEVEYLKFKETPVEKRGNLEPSFKNKEGAETLQGIPKLL